ncbi:aminomethyl transferase family protein [Streptomyces carpinensis]|uniref:Aminomethyl transferase family protein n=1 Tax=Streptomyces carpinensis TaxID=66369 RepID=A0ABV1W690_9ACTN|nr:aminomethyl transferase family protein [Streptomyces carpinensis]
MAARSVEDLIQEAGSAVRMLREAPIGKYPFPIPAEVTNWRDEQRKWATEAIFYDITSFGSNVYFKGPDVRKLFSETAANNFATFGRNRARRLVAVGHDGHLIDDAILFGLDDDEYVTVGSPLAANWITYHAETGGYDVEISHDETPALSDRKLPPKRNFHFIIQGPSALAAMSKASGGTLPPIKFFRIGEFSVAGRPVRALNHTMSGLPGEESTGLEVYGPAAYADEVKAAILAAGAEFGLQEGGALSYPTTCVESGWLGMPVPGIYSGEAHRSYREWLGTDSWEARNSLGGSYVREDITDYYVTPWELGYHKSVNLDHDFVGRDGLLRRREDQSRRQVWLKWHNDDVARTIASSLFDELPARELTIPTPCYAAHNYDTVLLGDTEIGWSGWSGYTVNIGSFASLGVIDQQYAQDGTEVVIVWGEPDGGLRRPGAMRHRQTEIRATVRTTSPR